MPRDTAPSVIGEKRQLRGWPLPTTLNARKKLHWLRAFTANGAYRWRARCQCRERVRATTGLIPPITSNPWLALCSELVPDRGSADDAARHRRTSPILRPVFTLHPLASGTSPALDGVNLAPFRHRRLRQHRHGAPLTATDPTGAIFVWVSASSGMDRRPSKAGAPPVGDCLVTHGLAACWCGWRPPTASGVPSAPPAVIPVFSSTLGFAGLHRDPPSMPPRRLLVQHPRAEPRRRNINFIAAGAGGPYRTAAGPDVRAPPASPHPVDGANVPLATNVLTWAWHGAGSHRRVNAAGGSQASRLSPAAMPLAMAGSPRPQESRLPRHSDFDQPR
jgi:hypothetical protein